jgi:hypothetical protein
MKISGTLLAGCLLLLFNSAVVSQAQDEKNDAAKPAQQQEETRPKDVKPQEPRPDKPAHEENRAQQEQNKEQGQDQTKEEKKQQEEAKRAQQEQGKEEQNRASASSNERGRNQNVQRIPDDKFRQHFGREHHFRVSQPVIVENRPRFQYSGYWFQFVEPWPVDWSYSDDCYIDYIDGEYFLFDALHPGVRLALVVVF